MNLEFDFNQYLNQCLQDAEFRYYWEQEDQLTFEEALEKLSGMEPEEPDLSLDAILQNDGIDVTSTSLTAIKFFKKENGRCPVHEFIEEIKDKKLKAKILRDIRLLSVEGISLKEQLSKYIKYGIFELRSKQSTNTSRVFYFFVHGPKVIMTNVYIKKQQKMDEREFEKACEYRELYLGQQQKDLNNKNKVDDK